MAVARIVGVVAVAALSALAAYFLYLKSKKENEGEKNVDKKLDVSESSNTYRSEIKSVIPGDATVDNDKNKGDNDICENEVEDFEKININLSDRPRRMSYRDALMAAVDNEDKKESETVVETSNQLEVGNGSCGQSTVQSENDSGNFDSMTSSVAFEFLSRPVSVEEKNPEKSLQLELSGDQISRSDVEEEPLVQIISQSEPSPISMEDSFVAVIPNEKKDENDLKTTEFKDDTPNSSATDSQPSIVILEQTAENVSLDDKIDLGSSDHKDNSVSETDRHPCIEILETSLVPPSKNASTDDNISNDKVNGEKGKEEVEISDLACDDDEEEDNESSSKIFVTEIETKRLTRGALKAMAEDVDDKEEITLLKESKLDTLQGDLDISDFSDDDDDSAVVSDNSDESEILEVKDKKTDDDVGKESLTSKDVDSKEKLEEKTSDDGASPSGDVSKPSDSSDKLNESLKIDLRPTWQVKKSNFVKKPDSTVSI